MTHRWIEPRTGAEERSDDPPGPGWLAVVTLNMPDGTPVASTPADLAEYLARDHEASHDSFRNVIIMDFPDRPAYDSFANGRVAGTILACPYFGMEVIEDDDEGVVAEIVMDPNATSLPPEEVIDFEDTDRDTILVVPGGGGGGKPTPLPVIPWNDEVPFPGDPDESAPAPSDEPLEPSDDMPSPDDSDVDLEQAAKDQADTDMGMKPDPDGDIEHPDGAPTDKPGDMPGGADPGEAESGGDGDQPCSECNGTGEMPSEEEDDGGDEGDDDGAGGDDGLDDEEQLLKELLEGDEGEDQPGDSDSDSNSDSDSDSDEEGPGKKSSGDGEEEGSNKCTSCDGTGQQPSDDGDDGDDDGDDDDDSEDLPGLVEATNATIEATNAAIDGYASGMDLDEVEALIASAVASAKLAHSLAEPRSVIQRSVLRKAVEAAKRALDLDALMERDR